MPTAGGDTGHNIGAALSKWLGSGDYRVGKNSCVLSAQIPMMHQSGQSITVRHREYIADIVAGTGTPTNFSIASTYALNPGLASSFPWLATVAQQFQEYTWKGLVYHFVSTAGQSVSSTNTAIGSVMMATQYRATAAAYINKQQLLNEYFSGDSKSSESFCHPIECDPKENPYNIQYVRSAAVPSGEDQKTYDLGVMYVATQGLPSAGVNVGELWATYEVELRKPIVAGSLQNDVVAYIAYGTSPSTTNPFGAARSETLDTLGIICSGTTLTFPAQIYGCFYVTVCYDTTTSIGGITGTFTNCTQFTSTALAFRYTTAIAVPAGPSYLSFGFYVPFNAAASTVAIAVTTMVGSSACILVITQLPQGSLALY
jgi:hypothetical protein